MKKKIMLCLLLALVFFTGAASCAEFPAQGGQAQLDEILLSYAEKEIILSDKLQIVQNEVNFRESPGGKVLGRLQGGTVLDCLDETQYREELWYHARSAEYGEGYVMCTFARPVWNNMNWWPLSEAADIVSDNMLLFAYWMGAYQLDHGLSVIETVGSDQQLDIAPLTVRGNEALIPEDMKVLLVSRLYEYGFICRNASYDQLTDPSLSIEEKNDIAVSVLQKHYGTDNVWKIIEKQSVILFIHVNDLHARQEGPASGRDQMLQHAMITKLIEEHTSDGRSGNMPVDFLISSVMQNICPEYQLFGCAPVGNEGKEFIVLARDSENRGAVMMINTEPSSAGVEFCNDRIMEEIPLDRNKVQVMDHMLDGHPYVWYTNNDSPDFLYVVFRKSDHGKWLVHEAQFGDGWHELYWFRYSGEDQKIHVFLAGNDLIALSGDVFDRNAESFDPAAVRQSLRKILEPYKE